MEKQVLVIMGSDSDWPVMKKALEVLRKFGVGFEARVASAHRTTEQALELAKKAHEVGYSVIIAGAGAAAHLPGVLAAVTPLPVIGVPINGTALQGVDALYAMVQMPSGIPVATVAIDGAKNAALLAVQILSVKENKLRQQLIEYKRKMASEVSEKDKKIQQLVAEL
ncbi:MAG TPA: 5-(carboxyamino)imidazole ribonucleotide mutase [Peptococcaceae bacterium]|nr:5-(carboxyamino)imidazole ribonucleotide mutase [Peptococcaceae bacterium]HPZ71028.1 5-(carboxyamino)imidazole ribonucleotide mutase [Peptococcaceae bacterium]HQD54321.1 5-(carboxyamino)imidazole ribonucleotide mutase [Peptococcaceae bacterium]